jgi:hypothetical protein
MGGTTSWLESHYKTTVQMLAGRKIERTKNRPAMLVDSVVERHPVGELIKGVFYVVVDGFHERHYH